MAIAKVDMRRARTLAREYKDLGVLISPQEIARSLFHHERAIHEARKAKQRKDQEN